MRMKGVNMSASCVKAMGTSQLLLVLLLAVAALPTSTMASEAATPRSEMEETDTDVWERETEALDMEDMGTGSMEIDVTPDGPSFGGEFIPDSDITSCHPCQCFGSTMDCSACHLRAFLMKTTATNITKLDLENNILEDLPSAVFTRLPNLRSLMVTDNYIASVDKDAFQGLYNLEMLDMSGNAMSTLPATVLSNHLHLRKLYMGRNYLTDIIFLTHIRNCSLEMVQLTVNALTRLPVQTFGRCTGLKEIWLNANKISRIDEDAFDGLVSLNTLDLSSNMLTEIPSEAFHYLKALKVLDLSRNQLVTIDGGLFETLTSLRSLYLSFNWLRSIPVNAFSNCVSLRRLSLSYNLIDFIDEDAFTSIPPENLPPKRVIHPKCPILTNRTANIAIKYLDLSHNHIREIPADSFMTFTNMEEMNLEFNLITTFGRDMVCLAGILQDRLQFTGNRLVCTCGELYDAYRLSEKISPDFQPECLHSGEPWVVLKSRRCREKTSLAGSEGKMERVMMPPVLPLPPPPPRPVDNGLHAAIVAPILAVAFVSSLAAMGVSMFRRYRRVKFEVPQVDTVQMTRYSRAPTFSSSTITNSTDISRL